MTRPSTIPGLLWRLARHYPMRSLALGVVGILTIVAAGRINGQAAAEACPFEQTWEQGDLHFWQKLVFDHEGNGTWATGGMDSDAPQQRVDFRWQRDRTTLTAVTGGESRTVGYVIELYNDRLCALTFDDSFLDEDQSRHYYADPR